MIISTTDYEKILMEEKPTVLVGYVAGNEFIKQIFGGNTDLVSTGWWSAVLRGQQFYFCYSRLPNDIDIEFQMRIDDGESIFVYVYEDDDGQTVFHSGGHNYSESEFVDKFGLTPHEPYRFSTSADDVEEKRRYIDYFIENEIIEEIAKETLFVREFLRRYFKFVMNIDIIGYEADTDRPVVYEIKYKYQMYGGYFGINEGEYEMFMRFYSMGVRVMNYILHNTTMKPLSIFEFIENNPDNYWIYSEIDATPYPIRTASRRTSLFGKNAQMYRVVPSSAYRPYPC